MDLDALLARRPQLALVDELAHTNAPGSRHPKRYMDVEELIAAGIDVYTTLNVQHIESLNDVVARITRIRVRETVPDSIIDKADDIELIDLTPDDLIQRLRDGKVYVPHQAERAIRHYFSPGNLTALRELALRRTAQRVDEQMVRYMQAHAIPGPWAAGERVLACVGGDAEQHRRGAPRQAHGGQPEGALDRGPCRDRARSEPSATRSAIGSPRRCGWRSGSVRRRSRCRARTSRTRSPSTRAPTTSPTSSSCSRRGRAGWSCSTARWRKQLIRKAGGAGVHVLGRSSEAAEQQDSELPLATARGGMPRAYLGSLAFVAVSLGVGARAAPGAGASPASR